jgi:hypothetical protein
MVAFILSLAILVLFILALLTMGLVGADRKTQAQHLVALNLPPEQQEQQSKPAPRKVEVTHAAAAAPPAHPLCKRRITRRRRRRCPALPASST